MAITTAFATSAKVELMTATHNFTNGTGHAWKVALIKAAPAGTYGAASTNYSNITGSSDESSGTGYSAGGNTLTATTPTSSGTTAFTDFVDSSWTTATFSADGCMIYNSTSSNRCFSVHDFGGTKTVTASTFTLQFPAADASNAILRLA